MAKWIWPRKACNLPLRNASLYASRCQKYKVQTVQTSERQRNDNFPVPSKYSEGVKADNGVQKEDCAPLWNELVLKEWNSKRMGGKCSGWKKHKHWARLVGNWMSLEMRRESWEVVSWTTFLSMWDSCEPLKAQEVDEGWGTRAEFNF